MSEPTSPAPVPAAVRIRLQKFLASCGLGSRRACEEFITAGRVTVDGHAVSQLGVTVDPSRQQIALDGEPLKIERKKYYVLNKPRGVVCTNRDPAGRQRVIDFFPPDGPRLFPVGRLDEESEGLIVVTNDGDLAQKLAHPKYRIFRTYHVHVAGVPNRPALDSLQQGHYFTEGKFRVHSVKILRKQGQSSFLELVLTEGQNREVRRLLARIGHKVMKLRRVSFGPVHLGRLKPGEVRTLSMEELAKLHAIVDRNLKGGSLPRPDQAGSRRSSSKGRPPREARIQSGDRTPQADGTSEGVRRTTKGRRPAKGPPVGGKRPAGKGQRFQKPRRDERTKPRRGAGRFKR